MVLLIAGWSVQRLISCTAFTWTPASIIGPLTSRGSAPPSGCMTVRGTGGCAWHLWLVNDRADILYTIHVFLRIAENQYGPVHTEIRQRSISDWILEVWGSYVFLALNKGRVSPCSSAYEGPFHCVTFAMTPVMFLCLPPATFAAITGLWRPSSPSGGSLIHRLSSSFGFSYWTTSWECSPSPLWLVRCVSYIDVLIGQVCTLHLRHDWSGV